jgi:hypothetical protein
MENTVNNEEIIELAENVDNSLDGIIDLIYTYSECKSVDIDYANKTILSLLKNTKIATEQLLTRALKGELTNGNEKN